MDTSLSRFSNFSLTLALAATIVMVAGCAGTRPNESGLPPRIEQDGYSFASPVDPQWFIAEQSGKRVTLAMMGRVDGETFLIEGSHLALRDMGTPAGLTSFVGDLHKQALPPSRYGIREYDASAQQIAGAQCVLSHVVAEDRDPETGSNVVTAVLIETVSTVCIHPADDSIGISLSYTHRSFPEDRDRSFLTAASQLLQTQEFSEPGTPPTQ